MKQHFRQILCAQVNVMGRKAMIRSRLLMVGVLAVVVGTLLSVPSLAQLTQIRITLSNGSILDGNVVYFQREGAEFLLEADASCYAFVFVVSPEGKVQLAFPNQSHPFNMLRPHSALRVPEEGYCQRVPSETGWARFVAVASEDPSWAYSFNEFYAPKLWDVGAFSGWSGAGSSSVSGTGDSGGGCAGGLPGQLGSARRRSQLRREMGQGSASGSSHAADVLLSRARAMVEGYRLAFSERRFYVASSAYASYPPPASDYGYGVEARSGGSWFLYEDDLAPYGEWVFVGGFGYIWRPWGVGITWAPYYRGRWVFTDYGWTWVSSEPWGWITYHYGYWAYTNRWGWVWLPGYDWCPANVTWYWSDGYVAWCPAPLPPDISISFETYITNYPVTIVPRDRLEASNVGAFAKVEHLRMEGGTLVGLHGARLTKLATPSIEHQVKLAPGPVKKFEVVPTTIGSAARAAQGGYYRLENQRLYVPKPTLTPVRRQPDRSFVPRPFPKRQGGVTLLPRPRRPKPSRVEPKRERPRRQKVKPQKVKPPREEPKKAEPKKVDD